MSARLNIMKELQKQVKAAGFKYCYIDPAINTKASYPQILISPETDNVTDFTKVPKNHCYLHDFYLNITIIDKTINRPEGSIEKLEKHVDTLEQKLKTPAAATDLILQSINYDIDDVYNDNGISVLSITFLTKYSSTFN